jgi:hypothetical protein
MWRWDICSSGGLAAGRRPRPRGTPFAALVLLAVVAPPAEGAVYLRQNEALALAFPGAPTERRTAFLSDEQALAVQKRARAKLATRVVSYYPAFAGDTLVGVAFFDTRTVRTMPASLMVVVGPDTTVRRVEVLAFHEPEDYRPPARWLGLFGGRRLDESLWPRHGIHNLGGATLTAHTITESARLALALFVVVDLAPRRAKRKAP